MYKKLLLVVLSVITLQTVKAQTEKGSQNLGVSFSISTANSNVKLLDNTGSYSQTDNVKQRNYSVSPNYSYFIANKLDLSVGLGYSYQSNKNQPDDIIGNQTAKSYFANISLRKYFLFDNKVGIRTGPYLSYLKGKQSYTYQNGQNNTNTDSYGGGLNLDFVFYPSKNIGLAAGLGGISYFHQKYSGYNFGSANNFNASFTNNLQLSAYYVFGK